MSLLPGREAKLGRLSIACRYESCAELGGDLYDYTLDASGAVAILVADVSGHGASAAMLTGIVKSCFRSASADGYDPLAVVQRVFAAIGAFSAEKFVTMFCARIPAGPIGPAGPSGSDAGSIEYVNAGHPAGLLWSDTRPVATLESTGPLISPALPDLKALWKKIARPIAAGDRLLVYTDGLTEAQRDDEFFGEEGIRREIANHAEGGAVLLDAILKAVSDYGGGRPKQDDFTLLAARID